MCGPSVRRQASNPFWLNAGHDVSGTQVGLFAIARCLPLCEDETHTLAFSGSGSAFKVRLLMYSREMRAPRPAAIRSVSECRRLQQLQTGCGRWNSTGECRRTPIPDRGRPPGWLSGVPWNLTFTGGRARGGVSHAAASATRRQRPANDRSRSTRTGPFDPLQTFVHASSMTTKYRKP